ncbi:hypothetical protein [Burkholderia sola]|nr:hypothetical protein [Burkholderia sola]
MTNRTLRRLPLVRAATRVLACAPLLGAPPALHAADIATTTAAEPA